MTVNFAKEKKSDDESRRARRQNKKKNRQDLDLVGRSVLGENRLMMARIYSEEAAKKFGRIGVDEAPRFVGCVEGEPGGRTCFRDGVGTSGGARSLLYGMYLLLCSLSPAAGGRFRWNN